MSCYQLPDIYSFGSMQRLLALSRRDLSGEIDHRGLHLRADCKGKRPRKRGDHTPDSAYRECLNCGGVIPTHAKSTAKHCSRKCTTEYAHKLDRESGRRKQREYGAILNRKSRAKSAAYAARLCRGCEVELVEQVANALYCNEGCKAKAKAARLKERAAAKRKERTARIIVPGPTTHPCALPGCLNAFTPKQGNSRYCGIDCQREAGRLAQEGKRERQREWKGGRPRLMRGKVAG